MFLLIPTGKTVLLRLRMHSPLESYLAFMGRDREPGSGLPAKDRARAALPHRAAGCVHRTA